MKAFKTILILFAIIPLVTGAIDLFVGLNAQTQLGVTIATQDLQDSVLDSQIRYLGAIWFGFGILLCVCIRDLSRYVGLLRGALAVVFLGGIGRCISLLDNGWPDTDGGRYFVMIAISIEIVGMPLLLWWQHRLFGKARALPQD